MRTNRRAWVTMRFNTPTGAIFCRGEVMAHNDAQRSINISVEHLGLWYSIDNGELVKETFNLLMNLDDKSWAITETHRGELEKELEQKPADLSGLAKYDNARYIQPNKLIGDDPKALINNQEFMGPDSFGGEDTPHSPAVATIREELARDSANREPLFSPPTKTKDARTEGCCDGKCYCGSCQ